MEISALSVVTSLLSLAILSLPSGYLLVSFFQNRHQAKLPLLVLLPLYTAIGLAIQVSFSFIIGAFVISAFVPIAIFVSSVIALVIWKIKLRENVSLRRALYGDKLGAIACGILFLTIFIYFSLVPITTKWPPVGDGITHSMLTSVTIYQGHVPTDLNPINPVLLTYPTGYHVFSANFSLLTGFNSSESVFIIATFIIILIASLLFTLSYALTRSYWISLPIAFTVVIAPSTGNLESFVAGYLVNGPFPNLYGFMALLSIICTCQTSFNMKQSITAITGILTMLVISIFVVYPIFLLHAAIFVGSYFIVQKLVIRLSLRNKEGEKVSLYPKGLSVIQKLRSNGISLHKLHMSNNAKFSLILIGSLVTSSAFGNLFSYYYQMVVYNPNYFAQNQNSFQAQTVLPEFLSDTFFSALLAITIIVSFAAMILRNRILPLLPLLVGYVIVISIIMSNFLLISPQRSLALIGMLSWPILISSIAEIREIDAVRNRINLKRIVIFGLFLILVFTLVPHVTKYTSPYPGWFISTSSGFQSNYDASMWLKQYATVQDTILNDRSYSSLYIHGFVPLNLTHSYWSWYLDPMSEKLSKVWLEPQDKDNVRALLREYNVKFIVIMDEDGYTDYSFWGGTGRYMSKPLTNEQYESIFNSYDFLNLEFKKGRAAIYSVR